LRGTVLCEIVVTVRFTSLRESILLQNYRFYYLIIVGTIVCVMPLGERGMGPCRIRSWNSKNTKDHSVFTDFYFIYLNKFTVA